MDTYTLTSAAYRAAREAEQDRASQPAVTTDEVNRVAMEQLLVDLALRKRAVAYTYARKRWALRQLVRMGVFTPEEARGAPTTKLANLKTTWRAARFLLRDTLTC